MAFGQHHFKRSWFGQKGWIRPTVLSLLEEKPMKGIEIMDKLEERSKGWWRPSPGSIYPLLDELSKEELVKKRKDGRYEITGKKEPASDKPEELNDVITSIESNLSYLEEVSSAKSGKLSPYAKRLSKISERAKKIR